MGWKYHTKINPKVILAKKPTKTSKLSKKVSKLTRMVKAQKPETKYYDVAVTGTLVDNNPTQFVAPYRQLTVGTADFAQRIGDTIRVNNLKFRSTWTLNAGYPYRVRMFAFIYKRNPDSVNSSWSTIVNLYLSSAYMNSTSANLSERDWDNRASFVTIYDKFRIMNPTDTNVSAAKKMIWDVNLVIPKKYKTVQYVNGSTSVSQNELFIGFIQESDANVYVDYHYRYTYTDA